MIVKNEEDWVEQAIESVISVVREVIIVDTGSTDRTLEKVERFAPRVIRREWADHFGDARNLSLDAATSTWILVLDADERVAAEDLPLVSEVLDTHHAGFNLNQRNYVSNSHLCGWSPNTSDYAEGRDYAGYVDNPLIRLFRNEPRLRFHGAVHEIIDPTRLPKNLTFSSLPVVIHHYGKVRGEDRVAAKQQLYLRLGAKKLQEDPSNGKAHLDYGIQFQELGRHAEAREPFKKAFELTGNPMCLFYRAVSEKKLEEYAVAQDLLERAAGLGLDTFDLHLEFGNVWLALGKFKKALARYRTCLAKSIENPVVTFNIGLTYRKMGKLDKARQYYQRAASLDPGFVEPALEQATLHTDAGECREAADILKRTADRHPEHRVTHLALAKAYLQLKEPDKAILTLRNRFDGDAVADSLLGAAYLDKDNCDDALKLLESAIRGDASLVDARINLGLVYGRQGEFARAVRHLRHGYEKTGNPSLLQSLSLFEARAGLLDEALPHLDQVIESGAASHDHWICRGLILERKNLDAAAREHYSLMAKEIPELRDWVREKSMGLGPVQELGPRSLPTREL